MSRKVHGPFHDEQGDWSAARIFLAVTLAFAFALIAWGRDLSESVWHFLEAVALALATWAGAPRAARYFKRSHPGDIAP